jgi:hypothetical protein
MTSTQGEIMTRKSFRDFVAAKTAEANQHQPAIDWDKERSQWLDQLNKLRGDVTAWLKPYGDNIKLTEQTVSLSEELIGSYDAPVMIITIGNDIVRLEPVGRLLIGARGRVDIKGPKGVARLVVVPKEATEIRTQARIIEPGQPRSPTETPPPVPVSDWVWKLASSPPTIKYADLTEDSFLDVLMGVVNG